ncbi:hypothetical protein ACGVWS_15000 [Enterobacteriaceae bacterium LUAb1]
MSHFKGTGIFLIKEQIYNKSGLPSLANTIGPTAIQVVKCVYQLMHEQEAFYHGKSLDFNSVNLWDKFKIIFGIDVISKNKINGKTVLNLDYCGFSTFLKPLDGFDRILPKSFSKERNASLITPYTFGRDPISKINLYRDLRSKFFISDGGLGIPAAFAKYSSKNGEIKYIESENEFIHIANSIK